MREDLTKLSRDVGLFTIAFGVAFGYALLELGRGIATFIDGLTTHTSDSDLGFYGIYGRGLTWQVGHHALSFDGILTGLVEVAFVLGVALLVRRHGRRGSAGEVAVGSASSTDDSLPPA